MSNKAFFIFSILFLGVFNSNAQQCNLLIKGKVIDHSSQSPLSFVNVFLQETNEGTMTDEAGFFVFESVCPSEYHMIFSHIGCEPEKIHLHIEQDTFIQIDLEHTPTHLGTVVIEAKEERIKEASVAVNRRVIEEQSNQSLSTLIETETGVHSLKNGSGISKPVIHGLFGNRISVLNNGIVQSGQQWGNDHAPEIDPFSFDIIRVLKGVSAIEYGGSNLGGIVLTEAKKIEREPHLHGQANYIFESNGRGHTVNTRIAKYSPKIAWRLTGTYKKYGDRNAPDYFLTNTGLSESNLSLQLEKSWKDRFFVEFYASTFNTEIGVLRGSHIGNLTDLESALTRDVPFFTRDTFRYDIAAPRQQVSHHLLKTKAKYYLNQDDFLDFVFAYQINERKEFDIRRGNRSSIPALSLIQFTSNFELTYNKIFKNEVKFKLGSQSIFTKNTNVSGTGINPLIPNYFNSNTSLFSTLSKTRDRFVYNLGLRYDFEDQAVSALTQTVPVEIVSFENQFHNVSGAFAIESKLSNQQSVNLNIGFASRNPAINELYSQGLHQGVSGIEEGDPSLQTEQSLKTTLEYKWSPSADFTFNALGYYQNIRDYIFLNPQDEFRLTIRGAFPVFIYDQTDAEIFGFDLSSQFTLGSSFLGTLRYSFLRGNDRSEDIPLVFIPPNSFFGSLKYRSSKMKKMSSNLTLEDTEIELTNRFVFRQNNLLDSQDFAPTPDAYNLFGLKFSTNLIIPNYKIRCFVKADNLLNVSYRDYLNRQRYFSDDLGISISAGLNVKF